MKTGVAVSLEPFEDMTAAYAPCNIMMRDLDNVVNNCVLDSFILGIWHVIDINKYYKLQSWEKAAGY